MKKAKIDNFKHAFPGQAFPPFTHLDAQTAARLKLLLGRKLGIANPADGLELIKKLEATGTAHAEYGAVEDVLPLGQVLASTNLSRPETVYLNWYRFDDIDSLKTVDFESHFPDIWYPSADDLDVFDDSLEWVLTITHNGLMRLIVL